MLEKTWNNIPVRTKLKENIQKHVGPDKIITNQTQFVDLAIREKIARLESKESVS